MNIFQNKFIIFEGGGKLVILLSTMAKSCKPKAWNGGEEITCTSVN